MKTVDIVEALTNAIEETILKNWRHEGYINGCNDHIICALIDGVEYEIVVKEVKR